MAGLVATAVDGVGATELAVPPVSSLPYQFNVAPDIGVASNCFGVSSTQYA